jgi:putative SOS response-associated peptidase YedK
MPFILSESTEELWLSSTITKDSLDSVIAPLADDLLVAQPVAPIRGKRGLGNVPEATQKKLYAVLDDSDQLGLF